MVVYGLGFSAVFIIIALLYTHALKFKVDLALTPLEIHDTKDKLHEAWIMVGTGVISIAVALTRIQSIFFISYVIYWLIGPLQGWHGHWMGKRRKRFE